MELKHVSAFVAVADAGTVSLAARHLHISQPALSRQISDLEQALGVRLFDRIARRLVLTRDGEELLGRSRRLLGDVASIRERAQSLSGGTGGVLKLGATPQFIEAALPQVLTRYRRARPDVDVRIVEDGAENLIPRVRHGEIQLAIGAGMRRVDGLASRALYPFRVVAVMAKRHRLASRRRLSVSDLASEPVLLLTTAFQARALLDEACVAANTQLQVSLESRSPHSILALAVAGHGIGIVPSGVAIDPTRVHVAGMVHDGRPLGLWGGAVWDPRRYLLPAATVFLDVVTGYCATSYPGHRLRMTREVPRPR